MRQCLMTLLLNLLGPWLCVAGPCRDLVQQPRALSSRAQSAVPTNTLVRSSASRLPVPDGNRSSAFYPPLSVTVFLRRREDLTIPGNPHTLRQAECAQDTSSDRLCVANVG